MARRRGYDRRTRLARNRQGTGGPDETPSRRRGPASLSGSALESGSEGGDVEDRLLALKQEMGLIEAPEGEVPKQLESGDEDVDEAESAGAAAGSDGLADAAGPAVPSKPEEPVVHEAQLIEEFDKLEKSD